LILQPGYIIALTPHIQISYRLGDQISQNLSRLEPDYPIGSQVMRCLQVNHRSLSFGSEDAVCLTTVEAKAVKLGLKQGHILSLAAPIEVALFRGLDVAPYGENQEQGDQDTQDPSGWFFQQNPPLLSTWIYSPNPFFKTLSTF